MKINVNKVLMLMAEHGINQSDLARNANVSQALVSRILNHGQTRPQTIAKIARVLNVDLLAITVDEKGKTNMEGYTNEKHKQMDGIFKKTYTAKMTGRNLRAVVVDGKPFFSLADLAALTGFSSTSSIKHLIPDKHMRDLLPPNQGEFRSRRGPLFVDADGVNILLNGKFAQDHPGYASDLCSWIENDVTTDLMASFREYNNTKANNEKQDDIRERVIVKHHGVSAQIQNQLDRIEEKVASCDRIEQKLDRLLSDLGISEAVS